MDPGVINDESLLDDLGVDSLMQISIIGKLRAYVKDTLPGSLLMQYNSISKQRAFFKGQYLLYSERLDSTVLSEKVAVVVSAVELELC